MATLNILCRDATCCNVSPNASPDVSPNWCLHAIFLLTKYPDHTAMFLFWQLKKSDTCFLVGFFVGPLNNFACLVQRQQAIPPF